jgi:phosphoglucosamine mutase
MPRVEFGTDGIRGIVDEWPFISPVVVKIGQALGQYVQEWSRHKRPFVVVGRDTRPSGADILHCLEAGLRDQGVDVIDLEVMTTPGVAFLVRRLQADLGVIVSASHSPFGYNGIKLVKRNGLRLQREEEIEIETLIDYCIAQAPNLADDSGQHTAGQHLIENYIQDHVAWCLAKSLAGFRVVLDCADGAASRVAPETFQRLGANVVAINCAVEGRNINYRCGSEHVREHPQDLMGVMQQHGAAYGFAFDGDGDRLVVVDSGGQVFDGTDLLFVLAMHYRSRDLLRGDAVVTTSIANRGLEEALGQAGIQTVYTKKGDKNLEATMWAGDYLLGGEVSGNIIINDGHHTAADAIYTALVLAGVLASNPGVGLSSLAAPLQKHPQVTTSFPVPNTITLEQRESLDNQIGDKEAELGEGSRILWWQATTEPGVFRVRVEGSRRSTLEEVSKTADAVRHLVRQAAETRC